MFCIPVKVKFMSVFFHQSFNELKQDKTVLIAKVMLPALL